MFANTHLQQLCHLACLHASDGRKPGQAYYDLHAIRLAEQSHVVGVMYL